MNREEIDEDVALELCLYCKKHDEDPCDVEQPCKAALVTAKTIREIYHSRGAVIKVDSELPSLNFENSKIGVERFELQLATQRSMKDAGYDLTESLVDGK